MNANKNIVTPSQKNQKGRIERGDSEKMDIDVASTKEDTDMQMQDEPEQDIVIDDNQKSNEEFTDGPTDEEMFKLGDTEKEEIRGREID